MRDGCDDVELRVGVAGVAVQHDSLAHVRGHDPQPAVTIDVDQPHAGDRRCNAAKIRRHRAPHECGRIGRGPALGRRQALWSRLLVVTQHPLHIFRQRHRARWQAHLRDLPLALSNHRHSLERAAPGRAGQDGGRRHVVARAAECGALLLDARCLLSARSGYRLARDGRCDGNPPDGAD